MPAELSATGNQDRTIVAVDLDYFYAQCEELRTPDLKGKPVVICVFSGRTEDSGAVSTSNYTARRLGVRAGIPIMNAKRILKSERDSVFLPMDKEYYDSISEEVMGLMRSKSDKFEQVSVDEAFLDVTTRTSGDFSRAEEIARELKKEIIEKTQLTSSIGVAPNKLLAKMASDSGKPNGLVVLSPDRVSEFLVDRPVDKLIGVGPKTQRKMNLLGIRTIGDLATFEEETLSREFGKNLGPQFKRLAKGIDSDLVAERPPEQLSRIITLKQDAGSFSFEEETKPLVSDIARRLKAIFKESGSISIIAITNELKTRTKTRTLASGTDSEVEIGKIATDLFTEFFEENQGARIRRIGIRVSLLRDRKLRKEDDSRSTGETTLTDFLA